jgi:uncharacterized protein YjdB
MSNFRRTLAALVALASWSCGSTEPGATTPVADIVVNPPTSTLALNAQLPLQALVRNEAGELVPDASVTWTVENPTVASVTPAGVVTALALGTTQVAASARGKSGIASITVTKTPVASVVLLPDNVSTSIGTSTRLTATAYDAGQNVLPDRGFVWTTSDAAVATVNNGLVTTKAQGTATITATAEGKSDATVFTVSPGAVASVSITPSTITMVAGDKLQLSASAKDANGTVLTGRTVTWASANTQAVTVSAGEITAVNPGSAHITATIDGVSGAADVTVTKAPVQSITVTPATVVAGQKVTLVATVRDKRGVVVTDRVVTWSVPNTGIASINATTGEVTGLAAGSVTATATVAAESTIPGSVTVSGSATVTVTPPPVATVTLDKPSVSIVQNASTTITATTKDAGGATLSGRVVTWQTSDPSVASLSATSGSSVQVTGGVAGTATITATSEGVSKASTVTVTLGTVSKVQLTLQSTTIKKNQTTTASAVVLDNNNQPLQGRTVTWTATGAATIAPATSNTSTGANSAATATVTGKNVTLNSLATITAAVGSKNDQQQLVVTP